MQKIETIKLVNNSVISAIDKLNIKDKDILFISYRIDDNGDMPITYDQAIKLFNFIKDHVNRNYKDVDALLLPSAIKVFDIEEKQNLVKGIVGWIKDKGLIEALISEVNRQAEELKNFKQDQ